MRTTRTPGYRAGAHRDAAQYRGGPFAWRSPQPVTHEDVARDVLEIAESYGLKLGDWFRTTDGEIIMVAVRAVVPA
jgi:hypothetical protein